MKLFYIIPIVIGYGIDIVGFVKWMVAYMRRQDIPGFEFGLIPVFFLPAWGISGLMYFGKPPAEIMKVWDSFLIVLLLAFCVHMFICVALPFLFAMVCNFYYGRKLLDMSPLPNKNEEN